MAKESKAIYAKQRVKLLCIPARNPDFNPIESFWGWLRKHLRRLDLQDLQKGRPPLSKAAYVARVKAVVKTKKAQEIAATYAKRLRKVCQVVMKKKGAASGY